jgi:hypothetical protein
MSADELREAAEPPSGREGCRCREIRGGRELPAGADRCLKSMRTNCAISRIEHGPDHALQNVENLLGALVSAIGTYLRRPPARGLAPL